MFVQQSDIPARTRLADGARLGFHEGECGDLQGCLRLPVSFIDGQAQFFPPLRENAFVQQFSGRGAMPQGRQIMTFQIFPDQKTVHCGGRTETGHAVLRQNMQQPGRVELAPEIPHKNHASGQPLAVKFSPHGLAPARIGQSQMQPAGFDVVPVKAGGQMPQSVMKVVLHHFGMSRGARGKKDDGGISAARRIGRTRKRRRSLPRGGREALPAVTIFFQPGGHQYLQRRTVRSRLIHDRLHVGVHNGGLDGGKTHPIHNVLDRQQRGRRHGHSTQFVQGQHGNPELHPAMQNEHDLVSAGDTQSAQGSGQAGGLLRKKNRKNSPGGLRRRPHGSWPAGRAPRRPQHRPYRRRNCTSPEGPEKNPAEIPHKTGDAAWRP